MDSVISVVALGGLMGLISNLHCIGMCGPIAMALPLNRSSKLSIVGGITTYTLGRSTGYAALGVTVGLIGMSADLLGVLQWLSIVTGLLIIIYAWMGYVSGGTKNTVINKLLMRSMGKLMKHTKRRSSLKLFGIGLLNAFLPCGMVYVALLAAMNTGNMQNSFIYMVSFGIATLPGFIFLGALKDYFNRIAFFNRRTVLASLISLVGVFMILRGLNLNIPFVSPKIEIITAEEDTDQLNHEPIIEAEFSCCSSSKEECDEE